ncbi:hypothetical protein ACMFMG_012176 [Clarireedia jacksonii]
MSTFSSPPQIIDGGYVDQRRLMDLLKDIYGTKEGGENNFKVELRLNRYKIYPPNKENTERLTEEQIQDCRWDRPRNR